MVRVDTDIVHRG